MVALLVADQTLLRASAQNSLQTDQYVTNQERLIQGSNSENQPALAAESKESIIERIAQKIGFLSIPRVVITVIHYESVLLSDAP